MSKLLLVVPFLLLGSAALAEEQPPQLSPGPPMLCGSEGMIIKNITGGDYRERSLIEGKINETPFKIWVNLAEGTMTMVLTPKKGVGCLIPGTEVKPSTDSPPGEKPT